MRSLKGELPEAVDNCIDAAGHEFDPSIQKQLLKAASFGKSFLMDYPPDKFLDMCRTLRVLNAVRHYTVALPLTYTQYVQLTPEVVVGRLVQLHHHCLADRLCSYLGLPPDKVLVHWACAKVRQGSDDDATCQAIVDKMGDIRGISFAQIARAAYAFGRPQLAIKLLDYEPRAGEQVPLLITLGENEIALMKALESGDTDLVYMVMLHLKRQHPLGNFLHIIHKNPVASNLLVQWCKDHDHDLLVNFYDMDDRHMDRAFVQIQEAYASPNLEDRQEGLKLATGLLQKARDSAFYVKATEEQMQLLNHQKKLELMAESENVRVRYLDLSVADTIYALLYNRKYKQAADLKTQMKRSDKKFRWLQIRATAESGDWAEMDKFARSKKSPIGYEPFVEECLAKGAMAEAVKYVGRCAPDSRVNFYCAAGFFREAVETALQMKSKESLLSIRQRCGQRRDVITLVERALAQLEG
eukprot:comp19968_c0_seq2/m.24339 comp19968_c0_seq2/g.24339  ORF comp19968_c0_seq2/g.24339 comp19968_c0_seq2/m.24339 type:complete len:469 (-) comp19968_c0_seq2:55-1461(-)